MQWFLRRWELLLLIALAAGLGYGYLVWRHVSNPPRVTHNYLADLTVSIAGTPPEQRAWPRYRDALAKMKEIERRRTKNGDLNESWAMDMRRALEDDQLVEFLAEIEPQLVQVKTASLLPVFGILLEPLRADEKQERLFVAHIFEGSDVGLIKQCLVADAYAAFRNRDAQGVVDDLMTLLRLADHTREPPFVVNDVMAYGTAGIALESWNFLLSTDAELFSNEQLHAMQDALAAFPKKPPALQLAGERALCDDLLQYVYTDDGQGDGVLYGDLAILMDFEKGGLKAYQSLTPWQMVIAPIVSRRWASRREVHDNRHRLLDITQKQIVMPLWQPLDNSYQQELERIKATGSDPFIAEYGDGSIPAQFRRRSEQLLQQRDAMIAATAVVRFQRKHDRWPKSLAELVPDFLAAVPPDRYTGRPLSYRLIDGKPRVYSWGIDKDDDNGTPAKVENGFLEWDVPHPDDPTNDAIIPWQWIGFDDESGIEGDWIFWPITLAPLKPYSY